MHVWLLLCLSRHSQRPAPVTSPHLAPHGLGVLPQEGLCHGCKVLWGADRVGQRDCCLVAQELGAVEHHGIRDVADAFRQQQQEVTEVQRQQVSRVVRRALVGAVCPTIKLSGPKGPKKAVQLQTLTRHHKMLQSVLLQRGDSHDVAAVCQAGLP